MKASELRIGNIVARINRSGEVHLPVYSYPFRVFSVNPFDVRVYKYDKNPALLPDSEMQDFDINDIAGIPLTEDWLVKFGFKNRFNNKGHGAIWDLMRKDDKWESSLAVALMESGYKGPGGYVLNAPTCQAIQYVHQLQNLYFTLTGEELTTAEQPAQSQA